MSIEMAFFDICADAQPATAHYVSLYHRASWYGGPEEGGWWGQTVTLVASQKFDTAEAADAAAQEVQKMADELSKDARDGYLRGCAAQTEWLEARGLDDSFLPEVDGEDSYAVYVEERRGEHAYESSRHWE